jgi:hypothetical protein
VAARRMYVSFSHLIIIIRPIRYTSVHIHIPFFFATRHDTTVLTFSAGARGCIGKTFALTEAMLILSLVVRNFELFPVVPAPSSSSSSSQPHAQADTPKGREELRKSVLGYATALTIGPTSKSVVFRRYVRGASVGEDEADV